MPKWIVAAFVLTVIGAGSMLALWRGDSPSDPLSLDPAVSLFQAVGALEERGFERVPYPWDFKFPADHGRHGEHRTEWWYIAGVLMDEKRRHLGVQLVLMRIALLAQPQKRASRWGASEVYAGLFSISDPSGKRLRTHRRIARAALELAGAEAPPVRIWVEDWRLEQMGSAARAADFKVRVAAEDVELELKLENAQPLIDTADLGEQVTERAAPFQFYVQPRMRASGLLHMDGEGMEVNGNLSMEHAWGELPLPGGGAVARDRFTLYLNEGRELFCIRTHRVDGSGTPTTAGLLIGHDGRPVVLSEAEIDLQPTDYWVSERTETRYPVRWALRVPDQAIDLELIPYWKNQEGIAWAPFWAGPLRLQGRSAGDTPSGQGLAQLNGYEGS